MSENKSYVSYGSCGCGCGSQGAKEITGCRFSLSPMSDHYIDIILGSIGKVDTSRVWKMTDKLSTVYRGKRIHVLDGLKACFLYSYRDDIHMTMEATVSKGCPGDVEADAYLAEDDILVNEPQIQDIHFPVVGKISLYPMGVQNYMEYIAKVVNLAIDKGIYGGSSHYVTILEGDVQDIFQYVNEAIRLCEEEVSHYIFQITLSVNSPTA